MNMWLKMIHFVILENTSEGKKAVNCTDCQSSSSSIEVVVVILKNNKVFCFANLTDFMSTVNESLHFGCLISFWDENGLWPFVVFVTGCLATAPYFVSCSVYLIGPSYTWLNIYKSFHTYHPHVYTRNNNTLVWRLYHALTVFRNRSCLDIEI